MSDLLESGLTAAIAGGVAGAVFTLISNLFEAKVHRKAQLLTDVCAELRELADTSLRYWSGSDTSDGAQVQAERALSIKSRIYFLSDSLALIHDRAKLNRARYEEFFRDLCVIDSVATAGSFEVLGRAAEPERGVRVSRLCTRLARDLRNELL